MTISFQPTFECGQLKLNTFSMPFDHGIIQAYQNKISITCPSKQPEYKTKLCINIENTNEMVNFISTCLENKTIQTSELFHIQSLNVDFQKTKENQEKYIGLIIFTIKKKPDNFLVFTPSLFNCDFKITRKENSVTFETKKPDIKEEQIKRIRSLFDTMKRKFMNTGMNHALKKLNDPNFSPSDTFLVKSDFIVKSEKKKSEEEVPWQTYCINISPEGTITERVKMLNKVHHLTFSSKEFEEWVKNPEALKERQQYKWEILNRLQTE